MVISSGTLVKFSDIQTEFGGSNPIYFSEYYSNASTGYTTGITGIPSTGSVIKISDFWGKQKIVSVPIPLSLPLDLSGFSSNHYVIASSIYVNNIPNRFFYNYDGTGTVSANFINDGGNDMYDGGNYVSFSGYFTASNVQYGTVNNQSDYGYFVSSGITHPHISVGWIGEVDSQYVQINVSGNTGSDGGGTVNNYNGTYTTDKGYTGVYYANINYNASDPTIGDIWFTVEISGSTNIISYVDGRKSSDTDNYNHYIRVNGKNFILIKILLSKTGGTFINSTETTNFIKAYVDSMFI